MGLKYSVNEKFFDIWSHEMAYVLGYLYADGSMEDSPRIRGKYIRVTSADRDRVEVIKSILKSEHRIVLEKYNTGKKIRYLLRIGNQFLFERLIRIGVTPRKSHSMKFPAVPYQYLYSFVRGYFDGDGCVHIDTHKGRPKRLLVIFTSGSRDFLQKLHEHIMHRVGVAGGGLYAHGSAKGAYQLRYSTRDSLRLFLYLYPDALPTRLRLQRKYDIFMKYLELRNLSMSDILGVLDKKGPMVKG